MKFDSKSGGKQSFSYEKQASLSFIPMRWISLQGPIMKGKEIIICQMVERKAFTANPKHQYHVSQCGEHDCSPINKKNVDYYGYPSLTHFEDEH